MIITVTRSDYLVVDIDFEGNINNMETVLKLIDRDDMKPKELSSILCILFPKHIIKHKKMRAKTVLSLMIANSKSLYVSWINNKNLKNYKYSYIAKI